MKTSTPQRSTRQRSSVRRRKRGWGQWIPYAFTSIAIVGLGFLFIPSGDEGPSEYGVVEVTGASLPPLDSGPDPALDMEVPRIAGTDFASNELTIGDDGSPKAVLFLAHWCPHCQNEVPLVRDWVARGQAPSSVDLYSVVTSTNATRPNYPPSQWLERERWNVPVLVDDEDSSAARAFGLSGFPFWVFVRADGTLAGRVSGEMATSELETWLARTSASGNT